MHGLHARRSRRLIRKCNGVEVGRELDVLHHCQAGTIAARHKRLGCKMKSYRMREKAMEISRVSISVTAITAVFVSNILLHRIKLIYNHG
jgi:hypothetical protein